MCIDMILYNIEVSILLVILNFPKNQGKRYKIIYNIKMHSIALHKT